MAISSDGKYIVGGGEWNVVKLWNRENQKDAQRVGHKSFYNDSSYVAISSDGKYIVRNYSDRKGMELWNRESQKLIKTFRTGLINALAINNDGEYIVGVSDSSDETVQLWHREQQFPIQFFENQASVNAVAISSDGKYIVSGSSDKTVKLWDREQQKLIHTFEGHQFEVNAVAISSDGKYIVSGSSDKTVNLWRGANWQDWLKVGCKRIRLHPALVSSEIDSAPEAAKTCLKYGHWSDTKKLNF